jgi:hypothetical protein
VLALNNLFSATEYEDPYFDPDYDFEGRDFRICREYVNVEPTITEAFSQHPSDWIIPRMYRQSYCIECMSESVQVCGIPIYKKSWGLMLKPFCEKHRNLLRDGDFRAGNRMSLGLAMFKSHWLGRSREINSEILQEMYPWLPLAFRVQTLLDDASCFESSSAYKILTQLFLSQNLNFVSHEARRNVWSRVGGFFETMKPSVRSNLHQNAIVSCSVSRAKALCYLGRVLGFVSDQEMIDTFGDHMFMPKTFSGMVAHLSREFDSDLEVVAVSLRRLQCVISKQSPSEIAEFIEAFKHVI